MIVTFLQCAADRTGNSAEASGKTASPKNEAAALHAVDARPEAVREAVRAGIGVEKRMVSGQSFRGLKFVNQIGILPR